MWYKSTGNYGIKIPVQIFGKPAPAPPEEKKVWIPPQIRRLIPTIKLAWQKYRKAPGAMTDRDWMLIAMGEGLKSSAGWGKVGAILVKDGKIIGKGGSIGALRIHAEHDCLKNAGTLNNPEQNKGATLYVTYQPCDFRDRTVPWDNCTDYLIKSGVTNVVYASPDPRVGEQGLDKLKKGGIAVSQIDDPSLQSLGQDVFNLRDAPVPGAETLP